MIRRWFVFLVVPLAVAVSARPAPAAPVPAAEKQSLDAFASANASCRQWSDGCVICMRQAGAAYACSTPGIACQPSPLACRDPTPNGKP